MRACLFNACQNGGTCFNDSALVTCICPEGFAGTTCELGELMLMSLRRVSERRNLVQRLRPCYVYLPGRIRRNHMRARWVNVNVLSVLLWHLNTFVVFTREFIIFIVYNIIHIYDCFSIILFFFFFEAQLFVLSSDFSIVCTCDIYYYVYYIYMSVLTMFLLVYTYCTILPNKSNHIKE